MQFILNRRALQMRFGSGLHEHHLFAILLISLIMKVILTLKDNTIQLSLIIDEQIKSVQITQI